MQTVALRCHSATPCEVVRRLDVQASISTTGTLNLAYLLEGDVARVRIPANAAPRAADKLWQHTCFEAFTATQDVAGYYEFNFAPSGPWAIYRFDAYREGMKAVDTLAPIVATRRDAQRVVLEASVDLNALPHVRGRDELRVALSAVIEDDSGRLSYWALNHPPGKPDFHHPSSYALTLKPGRRLA